MSLKAFDKICENAVLSPEKNKEILGRKKAEINLRPFDKYCENAVLRKEKDIKRGNENES